jgi:integrase
MPAWINAGRNLRYWEHKSRKHGQRPDRFWSLHYTLNRRGHTEGIGWWSQGVTQAYCRELLAKLAKNWRTGAGPQSLKELREAGKANEAAKIENQPDGMDAGLTLGRFWTETVLPKITLTYSKKNASVCSGRMRPWLSPLLDRPLSAIKTADLGNAVVRPMLKAGRSPATIKNVLRLFSVVWYRARNLELVAGDCPVIQVKRPVADNRRVRFLSPAEAARLLAALKERSLDAHDLALLSLFTGLRRGECLALTWADIDFDNGLIFVKDTKNKGNRHAFMTAEVRDMLVRRREARPETGLVFYGCRGRRQSQAAGRPFRETVKALGLNEGLTDPRQTVVFHSLRHTFASWLVMKGKPLYTVSRLLGHRVLKMTERYAHLAPEVQKAAVSRLEGFLESNASNK